MSKVIYLEDRSGAETDDRCGMKYYWQRKAGPEKKGLVPAKEEFALMVGRETHTDLAAVADMEDISPRALEVVVAELTANLTDDDRLDQKKMEVLYRRLGWLVGFALYIEPTIREKYDNVAVEDEVILARDPLWVPVTPDRVLRNRATGRLEYREYKTTISANNKWMHSWFYAIQLHIGLAAMSEELGEKVHFAQIMGLMKGYESASDKRWMHPYVWGWHNTSTGEWSCSYEQARGAAWVPMPVWEYPGGVVEWVQKCGMEIAKVQFPHSPPVFLNTMMLDNWVARRTARQEVISETIEECRESLSKRSIIYEARTNQCRPGFGDACSYLPLCWNAENNANPMRTGEFVPRQPHHDVELVGIDGV